jgi:hypothetical protein
MVMGSASKAVLSVMSRQRFDSVLFLQEHGERAVWQRQHPAKV